MAFLYINNRGIAWRKHSYSAGTRYDICPYAYYLQKILGWHEVENKARFIFGKALEEAVQFHHDHDGKGAVEDFRVRWEVYKDRTDLVYTKTEKDWETLYFDGQEMIQLYQIRQPELPIPLGARSVWQREYAKEVYPGDPNYGEIEDAGKLDIVAYVEPDHPLLQKIEWKPEYGLWRPLIVDIKTSGVDFPDQPGIVGYDKQLRRYSWLSGIRDVALLVFKKAGRRIQKGSSVTLLESADPYKAGEEAVVALIDGRSAWIVRNDFMVEEMNKQGYNTNAGKELKIKWLNQYGTNISLGSLTRQRLQFISGFVTVESAQEAGEIAGRQIVQIVNSWQRKSWPNTFGIRYPSDDTNDPYFRAFVLGDEAFKKQNFIKSDEESLDLDVDESESEE